MSCYGWSRLKASKRSDSMLQHNSPVDMALRWHPDAKGMPSAGSEAPPTASAAEAFKPQVCLRLSHGSWRESSGIGRILIDLLPPY